MFPLGRMPRVARLPLGKASALPDLNREKGGGGGIKGFLSLVPRLEGGSCLGPRQPPGDSVWPKPPGLAGHTPWLPVSLLPSSPPGKRTSNPCCLSTRSLEEAVTAGILVAQALCSQEGDLGGGDRGQGEGRGGISPEEPVQQLLLLLLELPP